MIGAALLAATAAAAPLYPVKEILTAFGDVCFDPAADMANGTELTPTQKAGVWKRVALAKGWVEIAPAPRDGASGGNANPRIYYWAQALDYDLFSGLGQTDGRITEQALFGKRVGGRSVFLSILGIESDSPTLAECRLRDPLGDGVSKSPIAVADVERWLGRSVKRGRGWYRGTRYTWPDGSRTRSVDYHFGFESKPFATYGAKYDPYSLYGMTLVRSDYSLDIII